MRENWGWAAAFSPHFRSSTRKPHKAKYPPDPNNTRAHESGLPAAFKARKNTAVP